MERMHKYSLRGSCVCVRWFGGLFGSSSLRGQPPPAPGVVVTPGSSRHFIPRDTVTADGGHVPSGSRHQQRAPLLWYLEHPEQGAGGPALSAQRGSSHSGALHPGAGGPELGGLRESSPRRSLGRRWLSQGPGWPRGPGRGGRGGPPAMGYRKRVVRVGHPLLLECSLLWGSCLVSRVWFQRSLWSWEGSVCFRQRPPEAHSLLLL